MAKGYRNSVVWIGPEAVILYYCVKIVLNVEITYLKLPAGSVSAHHFKYRNLVSRDLSFSSIVLLTLGSGLWIQIAQTKKSMRHTEAALAQWVVQEGRGLVVVVNKMDLLAGSEQARLRSLVMKAVPEEIQKLLPQVQSPFRSAGVRSCFVAFSREGTPCLENKAWCSTSWHRHSGRMGLTLCMYQVTGVPIVFVSALEGKGRSAIMRHVNESYRLWCVRLPTAKLNRWLRKVCKRIMPCWQSYGVIGQIRSRDLSFCYRTQFRIFWFSTLS